MLTLGGLFIVSALIGVIATGIDEKLVDLRKGRSRVLESDHTLILGWSETVFTIVSELAIANESRTRPAIVIMADEDKVEMEDAIREKVPELHNTRVVCRTGSPIDLDDLEIVNHQTARSVIVLAPAGEDPDSEVIKTVLALTRGPRRREELYHIVAEIQNPANLEAAYLVAGDEAVIIDKRETIARLIVQTSRQSGASVVYTELFDFDGDEVYFHRDATPGGQDLRRGAAGLRGLLRHRPGRPRGRGQAQPAARHADRRPPRHRDRRGRLAAGGRRRGRRAGRRGGDRLARAPAPAARRGP